MYLVTKNNILVGNNKIFNNSENLVFSFIGSTCPVPCGTTQFGYVILVFNQQVNVTVNFGNGVSTTYATTYTNSSYNSGIAGYVFMLGTTGTNNTTTPPSYCNTYVYPDGLSINRNVSISFNRAYLISFSLNNVLLNQQNFIFGFSRYPNLQFLSLAILAYTPGLYNGAVISTDVTNVASLTSFTSLYLNGTFSANSPYYGYIPSFVFSLPLVNLGIGDTGFASKTYAQMNMNNLYLLAGTLQSLTSNIAAYHDTDSAGQGWPSNFNLLTKLKTLQIVNSSQTTIPSVILGMSWIYNLAYSSCPSLVNPGNFSSMTSLTILTLNQNASIQTTMITGLSNCVNLKFFNFIGNFVNNQTNQTTWITNFYNFIVANASMTTGTSKFRNMTVQIQVSSIGDGTPIPAGTYSQPTGYVQGSNNGSPSSPLQMIWVMVNQYGHSWTYRTS